LGYSRLAHQRPVSMLRWLSPVRPSPGSCKPGSFSRALSPLRSLFAAPPCRTLSERLVLPGSWPSSRHHRRRPPTREHTLSRFVPPSGFCNLSTACSASGLAGLLHPAATSRVSSVQGFLPIRSHPDSSPGDAPLPLASGCLPARRLPPPETSASGLCSANRSVLQTW
jgi:hypothetical protein